MFQLQNCLIQLSFRRRADRSLFSRTANSSNATQQLFAMLRQITVRQTSAVVLQSGFSVQPAVQGFSLATQRNSSRSCGLISLLSSCINFKVRMFYSGKYAYNKRICVSGADTGRARLWYKTQLQLQARPNAIEQQNKTSAFVY